MNRPNLPSTREQFFESFETDKRAAPATTGRFIVTFRYGAEEEGRKLLETAGFTIAHADDVADGILREDEAESADILIFPRVAMALLSGAPEQYERVKAIDAESNPDSPILSVTPELVVQSTNVRVDHMSEYIRGYSDAAARLRDEFLAARANSELNFNRDSEFAFNELAFTWGLQATRTHTSRFTGGGVRLAVLDTGLDINHRDFNGRIRTQHGQSFVWGVPSIMDGNGHGTHCAGIACGPQRPAAGPRYGVAPDVEIFIGKVLDDRGLGAEASLLAGIDWAIKNRCEIVSMSIEQKVFKGGGFSSQHEALGRRALDNSLVLIASAGNFSNRRNQFIMPVSAPANCPSIMAVGAVGAVNRETRISNFSNGGINPNGGEVDIVAPGESIHSSFPPNIYRRDSGTSMATPFVAGIAALFAQADPAVRGRQLLGLLARAASKIGARPEDAGAGLIQAPQ
jgi:subtilisin family serine protease